MSNAERLIGALAAVFGESEAEVDEALIERMIAALEPVTSDDVTVLMTGSDDSFETTREGLDGLRAGWADWLDTFGQIRFEIEAVEQIGDNVLTFGRQIGTTRTGAVEIEQPSAAVWKFRDDLIYRVEFHLDREKAEHSARESGP
jgi:ketosteroid isomerase-like protein